MMAVLAELPLTNQTLPKGLIYDHHSLLSGVSVAQTQTAVQYSTIQYRTQRNCHTLGAGSAVGPSKTGTADEVQSCRE